MKKSIFTTFALFTVIILWLSSCSTQYPKYTGRYNHKADKSIAATEKNVKPVLKQEAPSSSANSASSPGDDVIRETHVVSTPEIVPVPLTKATEGSNCSSASKGSNNKPLHKSLSVKQRLAQLTTKITNNGKRKSNSVEVINVSSQHHHANMYDGQTHLAVKGLIFILIGVLLQGLWFVGPIGIVIAVVGIILIIYGIILLLESL